ncbi:MAG: hypothetical protein BGO55_00550 [Sphingobacteriales bacterium 50-39]|nr:hypothetical protein [Sphingobacteriales bacterium]OJW53604.1 MAG: hypothetical protein BGO55_00550 [Sphingobacteriales bacterium 50-39]
MKRHLLIIALLLPCFLQAQTYVFGVNIGSTGGTGPTITRTPSTLSGFSTTLGTASTGQSSSISGTNLTADIVCNATTNYEVSLSLASGYTSSVTLTQSGGTVSPTNVYWRLKSSATAGHHNEVANLTSTGATTKTVTLDGDVLTTPDTVRIQMDTTVAFDVSPFLVLRGDPGKHTITASLSGTTISATTGPTSNWTFFAGACIGPSNGITNATIPTGYTGVMREGFVQGATYQTTNPQITLNGLLPNTSYTVKLSGTTQYNVAAKGNYNVKGTTLQTVQTLANYNGSPNTSTELSFPGVVSDSNGTIVIYVGKTNTTGGTDCALISYAIFIKE